MKTIIMELALMQYLNFRQKLIVPNIAWGAGLNHECDLFVVSRSGYATEIEIKISKSDILRDKKKWHNHNSEKIKYLYFAVPVELIDFAILNIPSRAGLLSVMTISVGRTKYQVEVIKKAETNSAAMALADDEIYNIARLGAMRIYGLKRRVAIAENSIKKDTLL